MTGTAEIIRNDAGVRQVKITLDDGRTQILVPDRNKVYWDDSECNADILEAAREWGESQGYKLDVQR